MYGDKLVDYGHFTLREMVQRSGIFDLWCSEVRGEGSFVPCLVRRLLPPYSQSADYVSIFRARCREAQDFEHPYLLGPIAFGIVDTIPHVVLRLLRGWNLEDLLLSNVQTGRMMPPETAVQLSLPVIHMLASAHAPPGGLLVHGALYPSSIWVDTKGVGHVADLEVGEQMEFVVRGLARGERARRFLAPERAEQWKTPDPSVDVYSLGAMIVEMLVAGRFNEVQFRLEPQEQLILMHNSDVPEPLLQVLSGCLHSKPSERPPMARVHQALNGLLRRMPRSMSIADYLRASAPSMRELAQMSRGEEEIRAALRSAPRSESVYREATVNVAVEDYGEEEDGVGRGRLAGAVKWFLAAVVVVAVIGALYQSRDRLRELMAGPGGNMALIVADSDPPGAVLRLPDGKTLGEAPLKVPVYISSDASIQLEASLPGYVPSMQIVENVRPSQEVVFQFTLSKRAEGPATVRVSTIPSGARVVVDGKFRGKSPLEVENLHSAVPHTVKISKRGYRGASRKLDLLAGEAVDVVFDLKKVKLSTPVGYLVVRSLPQAQLTVDGRARGPTGDEKRAVAIGRREIGVVHPTRGQQASYTVMVREGVTEVLEYDFSTGRWSSRAQ